MWLFGGTYSEATEARFADLGTQDCRSGAGVAFAANVRVEALNSGQPHLLVAGKHGLCLSGGSVRGLRFECQEPGGRVVEVSSGVEAIDESSFTNCGRLPTPPGPFPDDQAAIYISGDARVTLSPGSLGDYSGSPNYGLASVRGTATLTVNGGTVSVLDRAFNAGGSATLDIAGVEFIAQDPSQPASNAIAVYDGSPTVTVRGGSTVRGYRAAILLNSPSVAISIDDATISEGDFAVLARRASLASQSTLRGSITNSRFANLRLGLFSYPFNGAVDLSLSNLDFKAVDRPILVGFGGRLSLADVTITDCILGAVILDYSGTPSLNVSLRRVSVTHCQLGGVSLAGRESTVFDLGTLASPGGNVLRDNQLGGTGQESNLGFQSSSPIIISAIGNSWDPNVQGTDANGQCSVSGAEQSFDLIQATGANFTSPPSSVAILRLAQAGP